MKLGERRVFVSEACKGLAGRPQGSPLHFKQKRWPFPKRSQDAASCWFPSAPRYRGVVAWPDLSEVDDEKQSDRKV